MATDRPEEQSVRLSGQGLRVSVSPSGGEITVDVEQTPAFRWTGGPATPWCGIAHGSVGIAALFPEGVLDAVEVRTEDGDAPPSLTPLVYTIGLSPFCEAKLTCALAFGVAIPGDVAELLARQPAPLRAEYGPAPIDRRTQAEAAARRRDTAPSINAESLRAGQALRERAERLRAGRKARMELLSRLERDELSVEEAVVQLTASAAVKPVEASEAE